MEVFPHLNLGHTQLQVTFTVFGILCLIFIVLCTLLIKKKKYNAMIVAAVAMITIIPSCCLVDATLGKVAFRKLHQSHNEHMPKPAECLEYKTDFTTLNAKYKVAPEVLKVWVEKYKLKEKPANTFKSKYEDKVQNLTAIYDPETKNLTIKYCSF